MLYLLFVCGEVESKIVDYVVFTTPEGDQLLFV